MLALCWHNVTTYYALNYAGIFDGGLIMSDSINHKSFLSIVAKFYIEVVIYNHLRRSTV